MSDVPLKPASDNPKEKIIGYGSVHPAIFDRRRDRKSSSATKTQKRDLLFSLEFEDYFVEGTQLTPLTLEVAFGEIC